MDSIPCKLQKSLRQDTGATSEKEAMQGAYTGGAGTV